MVNFRPERVREARLEQGWTQKDLAVRLDVTVQAVANWESGRATRMRLLNLLALAELTGQSREWFAGEDE